MYMYIYTHTYIYIYTASMQMYGLTANLSLVAENNIVSYDFVEHIHVTHEFDGASIKRSYIVDTLDTPSI